MSTKVENIKMLVTHSGVFHADDVYSTAFLYLCIISSKNPPLTKAMIKNISNYIKTRMDKNQCLLCDNTINHFSSYIFPFILRTHKLDEYDANTTIIYDIGNGEFDHHQVDAKRRPDGTKYASFGLLFKEYGHLLIPDENARETFDEWFVKAIDNADNGVSSNLISSAVSAFMPNWNESNSQINVNKSFMDAVSSAINILGRLILKTNANCEATEILEKSPVIETDGGKILILEKYLPFNTWAFNNGFMAAVYPSNRGGYNCCVVSDPKGGNICRFPVEWRGCTDSKKFEAMTELKTITFCHASGFMIAADDEIEAVMASNYLIPYDGKEN